MFRPGCGTSRSASLKTFTIYRSSAGSGKTRTLAREFLLLALGNRVNYFRHILAVTFANKATQEMKDRILAYLSAFAKGEPDSLADELRSALNQDEVTFRRNCSELQSEMLHHYDQFSISTIDAFFQKVIRSFTRESGLIGDYRLEVDHDAVFEKVIDNLLDELKPNEDLTKWIVEFAKESMENDKSWDVRASLRAFAEEILTDEFRSIETEVSRHTANPQFFVGLRAELWKVKKDFLKSISEPARNILDAIKLKGWKDFDFKWKGLGLFGILNQFAYQTTLNKFGSPDGRLRKEFTAVKNWPNKDTLHRKDIEAEAERKLVPAVISILELYDKYFQKALSAEVALSQMYLFGILSDIARKLQDYKTENNVMLLADAPTFLNGVIQDSDTPFIYERIGSFYRNYLIDEFQDTSGFQWKNFFPLLTNGLDQGYTSMVVGDVKQAIYRWRGGDLRLLEQQVEEHIGKERVIVKELDSNFRSARNIIQFNNDFFGTAAGIVSAATGSALSTSVYRDASQKFSKKTEGVVKINFLEKREDQTFEAQALDSVPRQLEMLQQAGVVLKDIAILVRTNGEGHRVAVHLMSYRNSGKANPDFKYDVVSNESLRMDGAASVNLILSAMAHLVNPDDPIARASLSFEFSRIHEPGRPEVDVFAVTNLVFFESQLPKAFTEEKMALKKLPLFELTETLIEIFLLGQETGELAYLQAFQDLVLDFYSRERNDVAAFLEWWESNKTLEKTSIKISGEVDAVRILTLHKAKGLEFKYVIIPFCSWFFDHRGFGDMVPLLWVKSDASPFREAGYLPVKYSGTLKKTFFQQAYEEERIKESLDNLNLMYVAFTRAQEGLFVTAPLEDLNRVSQWLHDAILQNEALRKNWNEQERTYSLGQLSASKTVQTADGNTVSLKAYLSSRWRDKLVIRHEGRSFFGEPVSDMRVRINYGIHLHAVLSRIKLAGEIPSTLEGLVQEGLVAEHERSDIQGALTELMKHPTVGSWFTTDWQVQTEVSILLPGGMENRIDRLMTLEDKAIIIDFKTGERKKSDQDQVLEYINILKQMKFKEVEGFLFYTRELDVVSIKEGKVKAIKKKDEDQLKLF